ncbi:MAG: response regulator, partial [Limisphaerales bacterium]
YLQGKPPYDDRSLYPVPALILTDLKMPGMDGLEFLRWLRAHDECQVIPTVVLSSSALPRDIEESYRLGVNSYICKPASQHQRIRMLRVLHEYWCMCERPRTVEKCK